MEKTAEKEIKATASKRRFTMSGKWPWLLSASLLPVVAMVYLYRRNMAHVSGDWLPLVCLILFLFSALAWWAVYAVFRSPVSALLSVAICWVACFSVNALIKYVFIPIGIKDNVLVPIAIVAVLISAVVGFLARKRNMHSPASIFVLSIISLLLLMNAAPLIAGTDVQDNTAVSKAIKTDFAVDAIKEQPNVYWFHCDGMLGFSAMEKYFGDSQADFANELNARGFELNRDAAFEAGHLTQKALPCLMSPYAYDTWISPLFVTHDDAASAVLFRPFAQLRANLELTNAFKAGGYYTAHQCCSIYLLPNADMNYSVSSSGDLSKIDNESEDFDELVWERVDRLNSCKFLAGISGYFSVLMQILIPEVLSEELELPADPLPANLGEDKKRSIGLSENGASVIDSTANTLNDILLTNNAPRFSILFYLGAHFPFLVDENGNAVHEPGNMRVSDYPAQHRFTAKTLLNMVDMILEADPDAVIVLQADHGLHGNTEEEFEEAFGTRDAALDMWNSVMSAIRVPEKYQNGDEHYALESPLNISRYLINSFVGHNYAYIGE